MQFSYCSSMTSEATKYIFSACIFRGVLLRDVTSFHSAFIVLSLLNYFSCYLISLVFISTRFHITIAIRSISMRNLNLFKPCSFKRHQCEVKLYHAFGIWFQYFVNFPSTRKVRLRAMVQLQTLRCQLEQHALCLVPEVTSFPQLNQ